jgi:hypothetical protein
MEKISQEIISQILLILKDWWWLIIPIILWFPLESLYFWWIRWEVWYKKFKWIVLEIKFPKEILKPFKAMENVYSMLWGIIDSPNWRERWCEGELPLGGGLWFSFELASFGGEIHFYMRVPENFRVTAESAIYSQYPDAEISLVEDYTKNVPQDIPNKEWDLYGENFTLGRADPYPIKTYSMFFEEKPEVMKEEKRLDPMDNLLEDLSKAKSGEQIWIQIVTNPVHDGIWPWRTEGRKIADKIAKRPEKPKPKPMIQEAAEILITGKPTEEKPQKTLEELAPLEFKLTPGEKEILTAVENKIKKHGFQTWIRVLHLWKRDEPHTPGLYKTIRTYFNQFMTENLNYLIYWGPTRTRIHYFLRKRRLYLRKRRQFREYVERFPPLWPRMKGEVWWPFAPRGPGIRGTCILNIEELATIFHFPAKIITPTLPFVEAKKAGPPPELPTE